MFMNKLKKVVAFGLALCIAGALMLATPPKTVLAGDVDVAPFTIHDPYIDGDDD